jgi:hypothetical protein
MTKQERELEMRAEMPLRVMHEGEEITQPDAERKLNGLVIDCAKDVALKIPILNTHYPLEGRTMIVKDYLLWAQKYKHYVPSGFYEARVNEIMACVPEFNPVRS